MTIRLAITPGDPAGIGPDVLLKIIQQDQPVQLVAVADPEMLRQRARQLGLPVNIERLSFATPPRSTAAQMLSVIPVACPHPVIAGKGDSRHASYILETLDTAITLCQQGQAQGLVTGPVNKGLIHAAGFEFHGHTEYLATKTGSPHVVMMLATPKLRIALATTHLPLRKVADAITPVLVENTIRVLHRDLARYFTTRVPRILVCGLNPHAGDQGALGQEEIQIIQPVIERLAKEGIAVSGPFSADTIFSASNLAQADVFLAMYHDQGLPVLKSQGFGEAVNVTLGLNIIRTSVDHGTAFELAGTGRADSGSLHQAIMMAHHMCLHQGH